MDKQQLIKLKQLLKSRKLMVAAAESITCGHLQAALGSISGSSDYLAGGITAYNLEQKTRLLQIDRDHALSVNCVSRQVAVEMAKAACVLFAADIGLSTTGYAEPSATYGIKTPLAYFAICMRKADSIQRVADGTVEGAGLGRVAMQLHVTQTVLETLLDYIENNEIFCDD